MWFGEWELLPGDSLVSKIFEEGLATADAMVIVVSKHSLGKPIRVRWRRMGRTRRFGTHRSSWPTGLVARRLGPGPAAAGRGRHHYASERIVPHGRATFLVSTSRGDRAARGPSGPTAHASDLPGDVEDHLF